MRARSLTCWRDNVTKSIGASYNKFMPTNQALQVFYGIIPLILVLAAIYFRKQMLLKDILERLRTVRTTLVDVVRRLTILETRAGIVYHE